MIEDRRLEYRRKIGGIEMVKQNFTGIDLQELEDERIEIDLDYLANILVRIFLSQKCKENKHTLKMCDECDPRRNRYNH